MSVKTKKEETMKPIYIIDPEHAKLHISKGNSKLGKGIYSFATLPGNSDHLLTLNSGKVLLTDIPGTCTKYCSNCAKDGACYAWRDAKLHHNVTIRAWGENTILLRSGEVFYLISEFIAKKNQKFRKTHLEEDKVVKTFRINTSGEIESLKELLGWIVVARTNPEVTFGIYTKNYDALKDLIDYEDALEVASGEGVNLIPDNLVINVSQWHGVADEFLAAHPGEFNVFEYDDRNRHDCTLSEEDKARLAATVHCPGVTESGHHAKTAAGVPITCDMCRRCYRKTGEVTAVWAH